MSALCLIVEPHPTRPWNFTARLDGELIVTSDQPLVDGARELLKRGSDPAAMLTMRAVGSAFDSFPPLPVGEWAKWSYRETGSGPRRVRWMPGPFSEGATAAPREGESGGSDGSAATTPPSEPRSRRTGA